MDLIGLGLRYGQNQLCQRKRDLEEGVENFLCGTCRREECEEWDLLLQQKTQLVTAHMLDQKQAGVTRHVSQ
jgi:hypothetical protein